MKDYIINYDKNCIGCNINTGIHGKEHANPGVVNFEEFKILIRDFII